MKNTKKWETLTSLLVSVTILALVIGWIISITSTKINNSEIYIDNLEEKILKTNLLNISEKIKIEANKEKYISIKSENEKTTISFFSDKENRLNSKMIDDDLWKYKWKFLKVDSRSENIIIPNIVILEKN